MMIAQEGCALAVQVQFVAVALNTSVFFVNYFFCYRHSFNIVTEIINHTYDGSHGSLKTRPAARHD